MAGNKKVRVALIGAGGIAGAHAGALAQLKDEIEFAAVCEIDAERGKAFKEKHGVPLLFRDYREALALKKIDVVNICTPAFNHAEITCAALRAGKWAICEKPLAGSIKEVDAILAAERETGMRAASIFQNRVGKGMRALGELIRKRKPGKPLIGLCETFWRREQAAYYEKAAWRGTWKGETGGTLVTHAIHIIDGLLAVMGEPEWVCADAANLNHRIEVDDCAAATIRFKSGAMANIISTCCNQADSSRLRIVFENLTALSHEEPYSYGKLPWKIFSADANLQKEIDEGLKRWKACADPEGHPGQILHFIRAWREKTEPLVNVIESKRGIELIAGIYKSAITGKKTVFPIARNDPFYTSMNGGKALRGAVSK